MAYKQQQAGFALLISLIVVGVVLTVGMSILDLSIKQVRLSSNAKESEIAFHAANAGMECARFVRRENATEMETGAIIDPSCFNGTRGQNDKTDIMSTVDGDAFQYEYEFTWGSGGDTRCTRVNTVVASTTPLGSGLTIPDVNTLIPGYPETPPDSGQYDKFCEAGARCTVISVQGFNQPCSAVNGYGVIQREVLLQF